MKTTEELNTLKKEVETLNKKLAELNEDELAAVAGGRDVPPTPDLGFELPSDMTRRNNGPLYRELPKDLFSKSEGEGDI